MKFLLVCLFAVMSLHAEDDYNEAIQEYVDYPNSNKEEFVYLQPQYVWRLQ